MDSAPPSTLDWIKASMSANLGACVELAPDAGMIVLRDSKRPDILLRFSQLELFAFIDGAKRGEFDHLVDI